jgi:hypothetical protein
MANRSFIAGNLVGASRFIFVIFEARLLLSLIKRKFGKSCDSVVHLAVIISLANFYVKRR